MKDYDVYFFLLAGGLFSILFGIAIGVSLILDVAPPIGLYYFTIGISVLFVVDITRSMLESR